MKSIAKIEAGFTIFNFDEKEIRVVIKDGNPWFIAVDLCDALNLSNSRVSLLALDEEEKGVSLTYTLGGEQMMSTVSESGMYTLILRCRDAVKPGTVPYRVRKWVTNEVLPAIRKTGSYEGSRKAKKIAAGKITEEQQEAIKQLVLTRGKSVPQHCQAKATITLWSALKTHFGRSYKEINEDQFTEALSLAARIEIEGEFIAKGDQMQIPLIPNGHVNCRVLHTYNECGVVIGAQVAKNDEIFTTPSGFIELVEKKGFTLVKAIKGKDFTELQIA